MISLGIDIGSRNTKIVLYDTVQNTILHSAYLSTDISPLKTVDALLNAAYAILHINYCDLSAIGVTGYGRKLYPQASSVLSEITCHAAACRKLFPSVRCVIDIGGQDAKIISIDKHGKVADFVMNDKCAAGTGRFLEMTAMRLGCEVVNLASLAAEATQEKKLNSTCVVFAESEIIGMMAQAVTAADIARAVHRSVAKRIYLQMSSLTWEAPVVFTGGVAQNPDLAMCLGQELKAELLIPLDPEITGAFGAALQAKAR